ncbi:MAG: imelysin family protein [Myxococcales bacterium]|nr:imelysin family protein [Myxococcales bacterium]
MSRTLVALACVSAACGGETSTTDAPPTDDFDRSALVAHLARNVLEPMQVAFAADVAGLPAAIAAHCDALDAGQGGATLPAAQAALAKALDTWELPEAVLVGPAAADMHALRGNIYGWPNLSPCELDRDVTSRWADPASYDVTTEFVSTRSLSAIEYLMYPQNNNHNCFGAPPGWDALAAGPDLARARCRLAQAIATDVVAQSVTLRTAWSTSGGGYVDELATAGAGSSIKSAQAGLNLISDGMFYVYSMVKDMKLGEAAGIALNVCDAVQMPCEREVELRFADRGTFAIRANLAALRRVFTGEGGTQPGPGFDDFLVGVGHPEVAARMTASLDAAIAKANALPDSFLTALSANYADVVALHAALKVFSDDMKSQFLTVLALDIPDDVATDND